MVGPIDPNDTVKVYSSRLERGCVRLLEIVPDSLDILSTRLEQAELSNTLNFVALSHFWGDDKDTVPIKVNGASFRLPRNIHWLLSSLKPDVTLTTWSSDEPRSWSMKHVKFWVDAICINHKDNTELAEQVSIMRRIYASATATYVAIGEPLAYDLTGNHLIAWLFHMTTVPWEAFQNMPRHERLQYWNRQHWDMITLILEKPWFFRRWVIQEVVVSKNAYILYGTSLLSWDLFADACLHCSLLYDDQDIITPYRRHGSTKSANVQVVLSISHLQLEERRGHRKPSLLELSARFRRNGSMRSVDRIFALLGICDELQANSFRIDYGTVAKEVLVQFAISHVEQFNNLDFLNACLDAGRIKRKDTNYELDTGAPTLTRTGELGGLTISPDFTWPKPEMEYIASLPSWTPNWTSAYTDWKLGPRASGRGNAYVPTFKASGDLVLEVSDLHSARSTGVLEVSGLEVDAVNLLNPFWPPPHPSHRDPFSNFFPWTWIDAKRMPRERTVYADELSRWSAFCRTLVAGGWIEEAGAFMSSRFLRHAIRQFFDGTDFGRDIDAMGFDNSLPTTEVEYFDHPPLPLRYQGIPWIGIGMDMLTGFRFAVTWTGRLALVQPQTRPNDRICIIFGCSSPIILSPSTENPGHWIVRGEAYVDGLMLGEAVEAHNHGQIKKKTFKLI